MRYKILLFDADNTIFNFTKGAEHAFCSAINDFGVNAKPTDFPVYAEINEGLWKKYERGEIKKSEIYVKRFELFADRLGISIDAESVNSSYKAYLAEEAILIDSVETVLRLFHSLGLRLFIITNGDTKVQKSRISKSPIKNYFEKSFISDEIGEAKPSYGFFKYVADNIPEFKKEYTLVIGDSPTSDIKGANNFGIDACYFNPYKNPLPDGVFAKYTVDSLRELYRIIL